MSINKFLLIISILVIIICDETQTPPKTIEELTCGKSSPKKEKDCTKYGTGSGMLCCWVKPSGGSGKCYLVPESKADEAGIDGAKTFTSGDYWSCGNKSTYINISIVLFLLILFSL